jgi:uncharacterized protein (TIGR02391 family)
MVATFPSGPEALEMPLDELAVRLLAHMRAEQSNGITVQRLGVLSGDVLHRHAQGANGDQYRLVMQEAWDWLLTHGLIGSTHPAQSGSGNWTFVTRLGQAVLDDPAGRARLAAQRRLDVDLHPLIAQRIRRQFILGEYELAALAALREVEIRVRSLAGASNSDIGVKLMTDAFKAGGPLHDSALDRGESEAIMALFRGAIGVFKNPSSHRQVEFDDPTEASEVILLADLLLRMLDRVEQRLRASGGT